MNKSLVKFIKLQFFGLICILTLLLYRSAMEYIHNSYNQDLKENSNEDLRVEALEDVIAKRGATDSVKNTTVIEMDKRRRQTFLACQDLGYNISYDRLPRALMSVNRGVVYCPVEKTASTFFRRYLYQLEHAIPIRSPFEVPVKLVYGCPNMFTSLQNYVRKLKAKQEKMTQLLDKSKKNEQITMKVNNVETIEDFLQKSTKFVFVRDPYSRLFSAYIDKLVAPNPVYWDTWGKPAIRKYRNKPSELSLKCGHDVTFQEFLSFVVDNNFNVPKQDPHLISINDLCMPCTFNYTVIGHMNTFERDVMYLSSLVNVTNLQLELDKMAAASAKDAIEDSVTDAFTIWSARIEKCMSKLQAGQRIWTKLQQRGIVSSDLQFPFDSNPDLLDGIEPYNFVQTIMQSLNNSANIYKLYQQRKQAVSNAYKSVSSDVLDKITLQYNADFKVFGFEKKPADIFG